jgi:hypothetical protein
MGGSSPSRGQPENPAPQAAGRFRATSDLCNATSDLCKSTAPDEIAASENRVVLLIRRRGRATQPVFLTVGVGSVQGDHLGLAGGFRCSFWCFCRACANSRSLPPRDRLLFLFRLVRSGTPRFRSRDYEARTRFQFVRCFQVVCRDDCLSRNVVSLREASERLTGLDGNCAVVRRRGPAQGSRRCRRRRATN